MIPDNARTLRITAAAGTELAGASFGGTVRLPTYSNGNRSSLPTEVYDPEGRLPARGMAGSDLRPLTNIPYCCLP